MKRFFEILILVALGGSLAFAQKPRYPYSHGYFSSINDRLIYATAYSGSTVAAQVNAAVSANLGPCVIVITPEMSGTSGDFTGMSLPNSTYEIEDLRGGNTIWGFLSGGVITKSAQPWPAGIRFPDGTVQTTAATGGGTPGGAANSIQYNNSGSFGGFGSWNGSTLTIPNAASNGITFGAANGRVTGSGGGYLNFDGSGAPSLNAGGTNQNITLTPSGTGVVQLGNGSTTGTLTANGVNLGSSGLIITANFIRAAAFRLENPGGGSGLYRVDGNFYYDVTAPAFSSTLTLNASTSRAQELTLTGNITSFTVTGGSQLETITLIWKQDATGGWTVAAPANFHGFTSPGTTASTRSIQDCTFDGTDWTCGVANINIP